jgi:hypothetical protein
VRQFAIGPFRVVWDRECSWRTAIRQKRMSPWSATVNARRFATLADAAFGD